MNVDINIPNGKSGIWEIETVIISEKDSLKDRMRALINDSCRFAPPGTYKRLIREDLIGWETIMSNTPDEIRDHEPFFRNAHGQVLINGLGLGICIEMIRDKIYHATIIENSKDVIKLVGPYYKNDSKVTIIYEDAFEYKPPKGIHYNAVWHDIWPNICIDHLPEMSRLHRKYGRLTDWQGSWMKPYLQRESRREKRETESYNRLFGNPLHKHLKKLHEER